MNYLIIILSLFAFFRIVFALFLSNIQQIKNMKVTKQTTLDYNPKISVIIPAYNEEKFIRRTVMSALNNDYNNKEIIVINDGSNDQTLNILKNIKNYYNNLILIDQKNSGKSVAINNGVQNYSNGELITVLDADSSIEKDFLSKMVRYFSNNNVVAMAANVKINHYNNILEYIQFIEYMLGHRLKGSEQELGLEYIIGGIGSTFRKSAMEKVNFYDTDTITEDIDFTLKLICKLGNKNNIFGFADNTIAYTEPVKSFGNLIKQRYRWKYGRLKALVKYKKLFFNKDNKYYKTLTFWKLPKILFEESYMLIDPFITIFIMYSIINVFSFYSFLSIIFLFSIYIYSSLLSEKFQSRKDKIIVLFSSPFVYIFLQVINIVDYISLLLCIKNSKSILDKSNKNSKWNHVDR